MAVDGGFLGNATDGIGQGLAFVLPQSKTAAYAIQLAQEASAQRRAQAALLQKQQQAQDDAYAKHLYEQKIPEHNQSWHPKIQADFNSYLNDSAKYKADTGKDPFVNTEFVKRRNDLLSTASMSNQAGKSYVALKLALQNDKDNKLDPDAKQRATEWVNSYDKDPMGTASTPIPELLARGYNINDAEKLMKPTPQSIENPNGTVTKVTPFRSGHVIQAQNILADPKFNEYQIKNGVNTDLGDAFVLPNGKGGLYYPTKDADVDKIISHMIQSKDDPHVAETFRIANIDPNDQFAVDRLRALIIKQNTNKGRIVSQLADLADAKVAPSVKYSPDRYGQHLRDKYSFDKEHQDDVDDGRDKFIQDLQQGDTDAREKLIRAAQAVGGTYHLTGKDSFGISLPTGKTETVPVLDQDPKSDRFGKPILNSDGSPKTKKQPIMHLYNINQDGSGTSTEDINTALNHVDLFKKRPLYEKKDNRYQGTGATTRAGTPLVNPSKKAASDYGL